MKPPRMLVVSVCGGTRTSTSIRIAFANARRQIGDGPSERIVRRGENFARIDDVVRFHVGEERGALRAGSGVAAGAGQAGDQHRAFDANVRGSVGDGEIAHVFRDRFRFIGFGRLGALRTRAEDGARAAGEDE